MTPTTGHRITPLEKPACPNRWTGGSGACGANPLNACVCWKRGRSNCERKMGKLEEGQDPCGNVYIFLWVVICLGLQLMIILIIEYSMDNNI